MYFSYSSDADKFILQSKNLRNIYCVRYEKPIGKIFNEFKMKYGIKWYNILDERTKNMWLYFVKSFNPVILSKKEYQNYMKTHEYVENVGWCSNIKLL